MPTAPTAALLLASAASASVVVPPAGVVVLGPGSFEVQLLASKLAQQSGHATVQFIRDDWLTRGNKLMYGPGWKDMANRVALASTNSEFGRALQAASALVLVAENGGGTDLKNTLRFAPQVQRVAYLSAIGGSKGTGGELGEAPRILACEEETRAITAASGVELSIVRVGPLKGGGASEAGAVGLDAPSFYDTLRIGGYPTPSWQCAQDYDRMTLGAAVSLGDSVPPRSPGARSAGRSSTSPQPDEISRINAAAALLACLRQPAPVEVSLSAKAGAVAPTAAEWDAMLAECVA